MFAAEFYKEFEDLVVAEDLASMLTEAHEMGLLPKSTRDGTIIVLYKKGDAREVRHYRPITLLNLDYKILAKVLVGRMKPIMDEIVSPQQLGFVPGRVLHDIRVVTHDETTRSPRRRRGGRRNHYRGRLGEGV